MDAARWQLASLAPAASRPPRKHNAAVCLHTVGVVAVSELKRTRGCDRGKPRTSLVGRNGRVAAPVAACRPRPPPPPPPTQARRCPAARPPAPTLVPCLTTVTSHCRQILVPPPMCGLHTASSQRRWHRAGGAAAVARIAACVGLVSHPWARAIEVHLVGVVLSRVWHCHRRALAGAPRSGRGRAPLWR